MDTCQFAWNVIWKLVLDIQQEYTYSNSIAHANYTIHN
jgi:hypothetical protein